jgi:dihydrofolate synthase/folylpolyglutamate synthase
MMRDKDHRGFAAPLIGVVDDLVLTQADLPRSATVADLHGAVAGHRGRLHTAPILSDAMALARRLAAPDDLICVTGSLMLVGEMKALVRGCGLSPIRG